VVRVVRWPVLFLYASSMRRDAPASLSMDSLYKTVAGGAR
jgi:hypothetical protein